MIMMMIITPLLSSSSLLSSMATSVACSSVDDADQISSRFGCYRGLLEFGLHRGLLEDLSSFD